MNRPLTITEILALRRAAALRGVADKHADAPNEPQATVNGKRPLFYRDGETSSEFETEPQKKLRIEASLSDTRSGSPGRTNTVNATCAPFTVLLWNVENYGEHKSQGNLFANKIIRHVVDRLDVDVAMFLETQSVPTDVSTGLEYVIADRMRTSKEKKRGPGTDPALKIRWTRQELADLEAERRVREQLEATGRRNALAQNRLNPGAMDEEGGNRPRHDSMDEEDAAYPDDIVEEDEDGDAAPIRGNAAIEEEDDAIGGGEENDAQELETPVQAFLRDAGLFQSIVSDVTGRQKPLPVMIGPYRSWPRTASRQEKLQDISRFHKDYSYDGGQKPPKSYWLTHHYPSFADVYDLRFAVDLPDDGTFPDYSPDNLTRPATHREVEQLRRAVKRIFDEGPVAETNELLAQLERGAVLTLRSSLLKAVEPVVDRPARPVIGYRNDGNACYLLSVLQLLGRIPNEQYDSGHRTDDLARDAAELIEQAARRAADGTYASESASLPEEQIGTEVNYHNGSTRPMRQILQKKRGWESDAGCQDAWDALEEILEAFGAWPLIESLDEQRLDHNNAQPASTSYPTEATSREGELWLTATNRTRILMLQIPKQEKTLAAALKELMEPEVNGTKVKYAVREPGGALAVYEAPVLHHKVSFPRGLPKSLLIRLERLKPHDIDGTKISDPVAMPEEFEGRPLTAFISHHGSIDNGHYTAHVSTKGQWFHLDDKSVMPVTRDEALAAAAAAYLYYYGPGKEPMTSRRIREEEPDRPEPQASRGDGAEGDAPIGEVCEYVGGILEYDPEHGRPDEGTEDWPLPDSERVRTVRAHLTAMIGTRNVETYLIVFRCDPGSRGTVYTPVTSAAHPNVGYLYRQTLLSTDAQGRELGYQDPSVWINGRCPYYFELAVRAKGNARPIRLPFLILHAPYGMPAPFRKNEPKKKTATAGGAPKAIPAKATPIDFDGTDQDPLKMRADAMRRLLDVGIPPYEQGGKRLPMRAFGDAIIAGDFNLDMCARADNDVIRGAYDALVNAGFTASSESIRTTLHPVETRLPADDSATADPEERWYSHAYDNIFVREHLLRVARTARETPFAPAGTRICGVVDVLDAIADYVDRNPSDPFLAAAEEVIGDPAYYHRTRHTPDARAAHELERWHHNTDPRAQAYFIYRRYISDHLPVFVDLDIHSDAPVPLPRQTTVTNAPRDVIGIENEGNTCYLNATLQVLYAIGDTRQWTEAGSSTHPSLKNAVTSFLQTVAGQARTGTYAGNGVEFQQRGDQRSCWVNASTQEIWTEINCSRGSQTVLFEKGEQQDAGEALVAILEACQAVAGKNGERFELGSPKLLEARKKDELRDRRPSHLHFFLLKHVSYAFEDSDRIVDVAGVELDQDKRGLEMECNAILYLDVGSAKETLQETFDRNCVRDLPIDRTHNTTRVLWKGGVYTAVRQSERIEFEKPLPEFLFITIKRFSAVNGVANKELTEIDASGGVRIGSMQYEVVAIIQHQGTSPQNGHYIAYLERAGHWWKANDRTITRDPADLGTAMRSGYVYLLRCRAT